MKKIDLNIFTISFLQLKCALLFIFCLPALQPIRLFAQNVGINATGLAGNSKAMLDIDVTGMNPKKGLLLPRMTSTERNAITAPIPEALMIYNTSSQCYEAYNTTISSWVSFGCIGCILPSTFSASAASSVTTTSFSANWTASGGATGYFLDVSTSNTFASFVSGFNNLSVGNVLTYSITGLSCGTTYYYRLRATNSCGITPYSPVITTTTVSGALGAFSASAASSIVTTSFSANWTAASGATGYYLDVSTSNTFASFVSGFNNLNVGNVTTYSVTGLTASTTYYYRVRASNSCGTSPGSAAITVSTPGCGYTWHVNITIDHTQCGSTNSSGFPVLVKITDATLKTVANGGTVTNTNGYDITFFSDLGFTSLLNWEIDSYDGTAGTLLAWVKIPIVNSGSDVTFYMEYGNPCVTTFQGGSAGSTWNGNYNLVEHFGNGTTLSLADATTNGIASTNHSATASTDAQINGAINFTAAASQYVAITSDLVAFNGTATNTISFWAKLNAVSSQMQFSKWGGVYANDYLIGMNGSGATGSSFGQCNNGADGSWNYTQNINGAYHYIVQVFDGTQTGNANRFKLYIDGVPETLTFPSWTVPATCGCAAGNAQSLGRYSDGSYFTDGKIDEFRVNKTALSADWITAEYNNQKSGSTFLSFGARY